MIKILFACHGNICRSPMAEFLMKELVKQKQAENDFYIASAATSTEEIGNPVHYGTQRVLERLGISPAGKTAVLMTRSDYQKYDYLIGMDFANVRNMKYLSGGDPKNKIYRLLDIAGMNRDVADPWYTGDFDKTYSDIKIGLDALWDFIADKGMTHKF